MLSLELVVDDVPLIFSCPADRPLTGLETTCVTGIFKKNLNASKPSEHPPQVEECLKV